MPFQSCGNWKKYQTSFGFGTFLSSRAVLNAVIKYGNESKVLKLDFCFKNRLGGSVTMIIILTHISLQGR